MIKRPSAIEASNACAMAHAVCCTELAYLQGGEFVLNDIFQFHQTDVEHGPITDIFRPTGNTPHFLARLEEAGFSFPASFFNAS